MKDINTSLVTSTSRQPFHNWSLEHVQEGIKENDDSLVKGILNTMNISYTTNDVIVLYGCVLTGSYSGNGNPYAVTAGAVYYNGEVYQVDAVSGTISGTNVLIGTVTTTYNANDPAQFSDGTMNNVHRIKKMVISQAGTGTGTKDYSSWGTIKRAYSITTSSSQSTSSTSFQDVTSLTYTTPNDGLTRLWLILLKGYSSTTASAGDGSAHEIYNSTSATQLDYTEVLQDEAGTTADQRFAFTCFYLGTISPNSTIKARFKSLNGGSMTTNQNKLICIAL